MRLNLLPVILAAALALVLLLSACGGDPEPTATPTDTPTPTATPQPIPTPTPTAAPQPTPTPMPTAALQPTVTPMPTPTPELTATATPMPTATVPPEPLAWDATFIASGGYPSWSPDGSKIVFIYDAQDDDSEIYTIDADGDNLTRLTNNDLRDFLPIWSPDGSKISLYSGGHLAVMDADGSNLTRLAFISDWDDLWFRLAWSPDGSKIAYTSFLDPDAQRSVIAVVDSDGSNLTSLTGEDTIAAFPSWSPDGSKIAFTGADLMTELPRIYAMDADGSNIAPLTDEDTYAVSPSWSPDGSKIAFTSGDGHIWVIDSDGGNLTRLAFLSDWDDLLVGFSYAWSPDGSKIAFMSDTEGDNIEIYTIDADGDNLTRHTGRTDSDHYYPQWSPDGSKIAFMSVTQDGSSSEVRVISSTVSPDRAALAQHTVTPEPTATPTPTAPLAERVAAYAQACEAMEVSVSDALSGDLNAEAEDLTWGEFAESMDIFVKAYRQLSPPRELQAYHDANLRVNEAIRDHASTRLGDDSFVAEVTRVLVEILGTSLDIGFDDTKTEEEKERLIEDFASEKLGQLFGPDSITANLALQEAVAGLSEETLALLEGSGCEFLGDVFGENQDTTELEESSADDRAALVALYNATDGPNWAGNTNWLSDRPVGEWAGVITDDNGRVIDLILESNQLSGKIPPELGSLARLEYLDFGHNQLSGEIPPELGSLANLRELDLRGNQLSGEIPAELGNLINLGVLDLPDNQILSERSPGTLFDYRGGLYLSENQLSGEIPAELGNLTNLVELYLGDNHLSGEIPSELGNLNNLGGLHLANNRLSGRLPPELELGNISFLNLDGNYFSGEIPAGGGWFSREILTDRAVLTALYNATNGPSWAENTNWLSDRPIEEWYGVTVDRDRRVPSPYGDDHGIVTALDLSSNQLRGQIPRELRDLSSLSYLNLYDNELSGWIPRELADLANLVVLDLYDNQLSGWIPPELGSLSNLGFLYLGNNQLSGQIPPELGNLSDLEYLRLNDNQLKGCVPARLRDRTQNDLDELGLPDCGT